MPTNWSPASFSSKAIPTCKLFDPLAIGQNIKEVLECDLKAEYSARELYREAHDACRELGDIGSMELFKQLLQDEEGHIDFLETELGLLERLGIQNYGLLQAEAAGGRKNRVARYPVSNPKFRGKCPAELTVHCQRWQYGVN